MAQHASAMAAFFALLKRIRDTGARERERLEARAQCPAGPACEHKALCTSQMHLHVFCTWPYRSDQSDATRARRAHTHTYVATGHI